MAYERAYTMSIAKIHTVNKSRLDQGECGKCREPLPAGSAYRWFVVGFRSKNKRKRCMKDKCTPKRSERESSSLSEIYALQEDWEQSVADGFESIDDLKGAWDSLASGYRSYAEDRRAGAEAWEHGNSELEEIADNAESAADDLESHEIGEDLPERDEFSPGESGELEHTEAVADYITEQADEAADVLAGVEL